MHRNVPPTNGKAGSGRPRGTHPPGKHHQDLPPWRSGRVGAQRRFPHDCPWRNGGLDGGLRLRQDDAHEHPRLSRPAKLRPVLVRGPGDGPPLARPAGPAADGKTGFRLPKLQPAAANIGPAQRPDAAGLRPGTMYPWSSARTPRSALGRVAAGSGRAGHALGHQPAKCPAASSSEWPSPEPW